MKYVSVTEKYYNFCYNLTRSELRAVKKKNSKFIKVYISLFYLQFAI